LIQEKGGKSMSKSDTPLLDQLAGGKWPSFVDDMKQAAEKKPMAKDLLHQLERSYKDKIGHWKHGGIVGVKGYGSGVFLMSSPMYRPSIRCGSITRRGGSTRQKP
jgi:hypothetical protein